MTNNGRCNTTEHDSIYDEQFNDGGQRGRRGRSGPQGLLFRRPLNANARLGRSANRGGEATRQS
eukprot:575414-Pleurochrysis_carterae.AAC.1